MTKSSVSKKIRITRTGKVIRRKMAQDHFRANKPARAIRGKRKGLEIDKADFKSFVKYSN